MHTLILTCAGKSTRFPNYSPKWTLTHPSGNLLSHEAIRGLSGYDRLIISIRKEHSYKYSTDAILAALKNVNLPTVPVEIVVVGETETPIQTVAETLSQVSNVGSFTVKDCDNYFVCKLSPNECSLALFSLNNERFNGRTSNKSYAAVSENRVVSVTEKEVVSPFFSCGAYTWTSPKLFLSMIRDTDRFLSDVMNRTAQSEFVSAKLVTDYIDWGTEEEWESFVENYMTLFVDIDGTLVTAGHQFFVPNWRDAKPIHENIDYLKRLHDSGKVCIVLTTSRPESAREITENQLKDLPYDRIVYGLPNARRVLINDYVSGRRATASAVMIPRNSNDLENLLRL